MRRVGLPKGWGGSPAKTEDYEIGMASDVTHSEGSVQIYFGTMLSGRGRGWVDDLAFEIVGKDVPTTDMLLSRELPEEPRNLGFDE